MVLGLLRALGLGLGLGLGLVWVLLVLVTGLVQALRWKWPQKQLGLLWGPAPGLGQVPAFGS